MFEGNPEFNRMCGEVLQVSLNVEQNLEHFISFYCGYCGSYKRIIHGNPAVFPAPATKMNAYKIQTLIQPRLSFQSKIEIFEEICRAEKVNDAEHKSIVNKIKKIQTIRNRVAHGERYFSFSSKFAIPKKRRKFLPHADEFQRFFQEDEPPLELTDEIIKELRQAQIKITTYMYRDLNDLFKRYELRQLKKEKWA